MKKLLSIVLVVTLMLSFVGCAKTNDNGNNTGNNTGNTGAEATKKPDKVYNVALVADGAGLGAQSFNDVALEGLKRAETDFGIKITTLEVTEAADLANSLRSLAQQGMDLIVTPSSQIKDAVTEVAAEYPNVYFALLDVQLEGLNNVISSSYREHEAAFLLGALGASLTKTNKIGYIGGISGPIQDRFQYGYMAGSKYINKDATVSVSYAGSFSDVGKGKEIATMMYGDGADFIAVAAGAVNLGVFQAAQEAGPDKFAFGAANGQFHLMPDEIVASQVKRVDNVAYQIVESLVNGTIEGGVTTEYGLKDGGVDLYYTTNETLLAMIPEETKTKLGELKDKVIDGTIKVPSNEAEYNEFIKK